jgi:hypothetical protein
MTEVKQNIEGRCRDEYESRLYEVRILMELDQLENDNKYPNLIDDIKERYGSIYDYGEWMHFADRDKEGKFFCYQFCWGAPQSELRIDEDGNLTFWFSDWGQEHSMRGDDFKDFIEYVAERSIQELQKMVLNYIATDNIPEDFN